jgi:hypothetical protein
MVLPPEILLIPICWLLWLTSLFVLFAQRKHRSAVKWGTCSFLLNAIGLSIYLFPISMVGSLLLMTAMSLVPFLCPRCHKPLTRGQHKARECPYCMLKRSAIVAKNGSSDSPHVQARHVESISIQPSVRDPWVLSRSHIAFALSLCAIGFFLFFGPFLFMALQSRSEKAAAELQEADRVQRQDQDNSAELRRKAFDEQRQEIAGRSVHLADRIAEIEEIRKDPNLTVTAQESAVLSAEEKAALEELSDLQKRLEEMDASPAGAEAGSP